MSKKKKNMFLQIHIRFTNYDKRVIYMCCIKENHPKVFYREYRQQNMICELQDIL